MQINPPVSAPLLHLTPGDGSSAPAWRLGDTLAGRLQLAPDGRGLLVIDGKPLELTHPVALRPGQMLRLQVAQLTPSLLLRVIDDADAPLAQALRQAVPVAGSLTPLTTTLSALPTLTAALPAPLRGALNNLLGSLPTAAQLQHPQGLREALQSSGLLLEAMLARTGAPPPKDLKASLHSAATQLRAGLASANTGTSAGEPAGVAPAALERLLTTLLERTEGAGARLQLLQAQASQREGGLDLLVELPVRHGEQVEGLQLRIRDEAPEGGASGEPREPALQVQLTFQLEGLGRLHAVLRLRGQRLVASLWAERPQAAALVREYLPLLEGRLDALGVTVDGLAVNAGSPPEPVDALPVLRRGMLNEKA